MIYAFWQGFLKASDQFTSTALQWPPKHLCSPTKVGGRGEAECVDVNSTLRWEESRNFLKCYFHPRLDIQGNITCNGFFTIYTKYPPLLLLVFIPIPPTSCSSNPYGTDCIAISILIYRGSPQCNFWNYLLSFHCQSNCSHPILNLMFLLLIFRWRLSWIAQKACNFIHFFPFCSPHCSTGKKKKKEKHLSLNCILLKGLWRDLRYFCT